MTEKEKAQWDADVKALRPCMVVQPTAKHFVKYECTPIEWVARQLYSRCVYHSKEGRAKHGHVPLSECRPQVGKGRDMAKKRASDKRWRDQNREKLRVSRKIYHYSKRFIEVDKDYILRFRLHKRVGKFFSEQRRLKRRTGQKYLNLPKGMSFVDWIVSQFTDDMTLENHGTYWHIDHWYPLGAIDCNDPAQVAAVQDYRNLRPLKGTDNMSDGAKVSPEAQANFDKLVKYWRRKLS